MRRISRFRSHIYYTESVYKYLLVQYFQKKKNSFYASSFDTWKEIWMNVQIKKGENAEKNERKKLENVLN